MFDYVMRTAEAMTAARDAANNRLIAAEADEAIAAEAYTVTITQAFKALRTLTDYQRLVMFDDVKAAIADMTEADVKSAYDVYKSAIKARSQAQTIADIITDEYTSFVKLYDELIRLREKLRIAMFNEDNTTEAIVAALKLRSQFNILLRDVYKEAYTLDLYTRPYMTDVE